MDYSDVHLYVRSVALSWNQLQKGLRLSFMWLCKGPSGLKDGLQVLVGIRQATGSCHVTPHCVQYCEGNR